MRRLTVSLIAIGACATAVAVPLIAGATTQTPSRTQRTRTQAGDSIAFMRPGESGEYDLWAVRVERRAACAGSPSRR